MNRPPIPFVPRQRQAPSVPPSRDVTVVLTFTEDLHGAALVAEHGHVQLSAHLSRNQQAYALERMLDALDLPSDPGGVDPRARCRSHLRVVPGGAQ